MPEKLAIHGGKPAVDIDSSEHWKRPVEEEKKAVSTLVEQGFLSGSGGGLPATSFVEAVKAEGASISGPGLPLEHLRKIFTEGFDIWGRDRGPLGGEFCGLPPFQGYKRGDFPVAESLTSRVLTLPAYIEPQEGFLEQYIEAFRKVMANYKSLL